MSERQSVDGAYLNFLRDVPIFGGLGDIGLEHIHACAEKRSYAPGEVLVNEGELGREMFVLLAGRAIVRKGNATLRELTAGDCIGEMSLIDIQPRSATVAAIENTLALTLSFEAVGQLQAVSLQTYTMVVMNIAREISRRLRHANELISSLGRPDWSLH